MITIEEDMDQRAGPPIPLCYNIMFGNVTFSFFVCVTNLGVDMARFTQFHLMIPRWAYYLQNH